MSIDEVQAKHSVSQFILWQQFSEWEANAFDKVCYYLAQLTMEVRRSYTKPGVRLKVEDFLMKFAFKRQERPRLRNTFVSRQSRINQIKQAFFALTGMTIDPKNRK